MTTKDVAPTFLVDECSVAIRSRLQLDRLQPSSMDKIAPISVSTVTKKKKVEVKTNNNASGKDKSTGKGQEGGGDKDKAKKGYDRWTFLDDTKINYGYLAKTSGEGIAASTSGGYYITTAINYTNGPAHIGHAYEAATSDVIARYQRLKGDGPTYFVTGSDEHGQKIATTAYDQGKEPIEICDLYQTGFRVLDQRLLMAYDDYIRTTSSRHKNTAHALWKRCHEAGDIYLDTYEGWYNVREETFVTENEAKLSEYKDPASGNPLKKVKEESYFFKMSKYHERLLQYILDNPEFIQPEQHRNQIIQRLQADKLRDLSISRTTFSWGIAVPDGFAPNHVMYVWVDALSNYLTGVNGLDVNDDGSIENLKKFWPASVHIIGKDILWFHTVIWPTLLMSAGIPIPKQVFAHGFVNDREGKKMSKSLGNVVNPHDILDQYNVDTFRWYLCKEAPYGGDLNFNEDSMRDMHNADLCDTLGNLVHRVTSLCGKYCDGVVVDVPLDYSDDGKKMPVQLTTVVEAYKAKMSKLELQGGASVVIQGFRDVNGYLQTEAPWLKKGDEFALERQTTVRVCLEAIYALAHLLLPFLPAGGSTIFRKLNTEPMALKDLNLKGPNLKAGTKVDVGEILYSKALSIEEIQDAAAASQKKKESFAEAQKRKKEARAKAVAASNAKGGGGGKKGGGEAADPNQPDFTKIDIRVGKIVKVWNHPDADKLFCEEIDVGDDGDGGPRQIASGLREHYTLEEMQDRKVLVVCNLKASKMLGFMSNGMVLAAKGQDGEGKAKVELIAPPDDAVIGERVMIEGLTGVPVGSAQVKKKKIWETVAKDLKTNEEGLATWKGQVVKTTVGPCKAPSLQGVPIS